MSEGERLLFGQRRTSTPSAAAAADDDSTLSKRVERTEERSKFARNVAIAALIIALLLLGSYIATTAVFSHFPEQPSPFIQGNISALNQTIQTLISRLNSLNTTLPPRVSMLEAQLLEILMMTTPTPFVTRTIKNGTFYWGANGAVTPTVCYDDPENDYPCDWQNDGQEASEPSTYELQAVEIGPLNLTVLVLGPYEFPFSIYQRRPFLPAYTDVQFSAYKFSPPIPDLVGLRADNEFAGFAYLQLTAANALAFSVSNGCLETKECILNGNPSTDDGHSKNTLRITYPVSRRFGSMYINGWLQGDATSMEVEEFVIYRPLHLLMPIS